MKINRLLFFLSIIFGQNKAVVRQRCNVVGEKTKGGNSMQEIKIE